MNRLAVFLVVAASLLLGAWSAGGSIGVTSVCENGKCALTASSSVLSVFIALGLFVFLYVYPQRAGVLLEDRVVGVWRRFGAFFLDFVLVVMIVSSIGVVPLLFSEALSTGVFRWAFERDFARPTDDIYVLPVVFGVFLCLYLYFYLHPDAGRQTIGQYILGYRVKAASSSAKPMYGVRVIFAFIGLCMWPISVILAFRTSRKAFWWDSATNTEVVRVGS